MTNDAAQERIDDLQNLVTELRNNLPTVTNSRFETVGADPHLDRIGRALALITEELRSLSRDIRGGGTITGGGIEMPWSG